MKRTTTRLREAIDELETRQEEIQRTIELLDDALERLEIAETRGEMNAAREAADDALFEAKAVL